MRVLSTALMFATIVAVVPTLVGATCYDGCSSVQLQTGSIVELSYVDEQPCSPACGSGDAVEYTIRRYATCSGEQPMDEGTFCTTDEPATGVRLVVQSIGSGCSSSPQGCVRLCSPCE